MVILKNGHITASIDELGAELKSLTLDGEEFIWEAKPEVWANASPILFPICGGLKNDSYTYLGKSYTLTKHGYAKFTLFEVERASDTEAVFLHISNEKTRAVYPFDYELRIIFTLTESGVRIVYRVDNKTDGEMYFSIGAHEGYATPEGIEDYDVIFEKEETLNANVLYGNMLSYQLLPMLKCGRVLPLYDKYFTIDALDFLNVKSRSVTMRNRKNGRGVTVDFPFAPHFLLWHKPNAPYMCLEPWAGLPDFVDEDGDLTKKTAIMRLEKNGVYEGEHTITVFKG